MYEVGYGTGDGDGGFAVGGDADESFGTITPRGK